MTEQTNKSDKRPKSEVRKRTQFIRARVTPEEKAAFLKICGEACLTAGDFIRSKVFGQQPLRVQQVRRPDQKALSQILAQLGKYGSNLNQIAHALNIAKLEKGYSSKSALFHLNRFEKQIAEMNAQISECHATVMQTLLEDDTIR